MTGDILIELDERRRASLGRVGRPEHRRYLATTHDDGVIVLRPVDLVPAVVGSAPAHLAPAFTEPTPWQDERVKEGIRARRHPDLDALEGIRRATRGRPRVIEP